MMDMGVRQQEKKRGKEVVKKDHQVVLTMSELKELVELKTL